MFERQGKACLFLETACHFSHSPHAHIDVVPVKKGKEAEAKMYFTNAMSSADEEWSQHKKVIAFNTDKPLSKCIPGHFQFTSVEWERGVEGGEGGREGLAHIIEDERRVRSDFALDVVAGMLKKDPLRFRAKPAPSSSGAVSAEDKKRVEGFKKKYEFENFDWIGLTREYSEA